MSSGLARVTHVIAGAGLIDASRFTEFDRERGESLHKAAELLVRGELDEASVPPEVAPRLGQFRRFLDLTRPKVQAAEMEVTHDLYRYVGHPDLVIYLTGRHGVLDIKGPTRAPWHRLQLVAYREALEAMRFWPEPAAGQARPAMWSLYLSDDAFRLVEHADPRQARADWQAFLACLSIHWWKEGNQRASKDEQPEHDPAAGD